MRPDGSIQTLDHRGPSIGFGCEDPIGQQSIQLQTGDKIMLYTDGLLESRNTEEDFFGKSRFYDVLKKHRHEPIQTMVDAVYADVNRFRHQAKPDDDISILGVEYCGKA
jgi:serine phosphatase RsbU (regulator of sigma subunit)